MLENISNNGTNLFESATGVLNIAPIKLSGQYKIVVDSNNNLFLDDYNSRRVAIDKTRNFLPQLAAFLATPTELSDPKRLRYGGFSYSTTKAYHVPVYIGKQTEQPRYFTVNRVANTTITDVNLLHKFANIVKLFDLKQIGISQIFDEISSFDFPVYFNWEDATVSIFGYSVKELSPVKKTFSITNSQANQPYIENVNNKIIRAFQENNIIFPKFLNIEFEFEYNSNKPEFNNFSGFMSYGKVVSKADFTGNDVTVNLKEYNEKIDYFQVKTIDDNLDSISFLDLLTTSTIVNITNRQPQVRLSVKNISAEDYIQVIHPDETVFYEYIVQPGDIKATLFETIKSICIKATNQTNLNLLFDVVSVGVDNIITIKSNIDDSYISEYKIVCSSNFKFYDSNQDTFYGITDNDIAFLDSDPEQLTNVRIGSVYHNIVDIFDFEGTKILRLDSEPNMGNSSFCEFFETKYSKLIELQPINFYSVNSELKSLYQFDKDLYIKDLKNIFIDNREDQSDPDYDNYLEATERAIAAFDSRNDLSDYNPYVKDVLTDNQLIEGMTHTVSTDSVQQNYHNDSYILNMMFNSSGNTSYITPNILNIDKKFYDNNGNVDYVKLDSDRIRFHWFLIKGNCPSYMLNDIRSLRYFTDKPKLTSRLVTTDKNDLYCETVYLGAKYRLPQKYKNYQFAVYLNPNDEDDVILNYEFVVDDNLKTVYLAINKYFDFVDLLRGGNVNNEPLIDLSFFYSVQESHNSMSEALYSFKSGGILICDDVVPVMFESNNLNGWRFFDSVTNKWYICLKRSASVITSPFTELFPTSGDFEFYVYSSVTIDNVKYDYVSMRFTVHNIRLLSDDYVWCEDLSVKFFDTTNFFLNVLPDNEFIKVDSDNIMSIVPLANTSVYNNYQATATIIVDASNQAFKIINPIDSFSIKKYYFEITRNVQYNQVNNNKTTTNGYFVFPDYFQGAQTYNSLYSQFGGNENDADSTFDSVTYNQKVTLFDRNQIWKVIKDILKIDVKFKHSTEIQTRKIINELLLNNLSEYSSLFSIPIKNTDSFIKLNVDDNDYNVVIWKDYPTTGSVEPRNKVFKISRYRGPYFPYFQQLENAFYFQKDIQSNRQDNIFSLFDVNYGGQGVSATGIWKEVCGNVVSSLFTKNDNINIRVPFSTQIDFGQLLSDSISIDDMIVVNKNEEYISKINNNIDEYIKENFVSYLLDNMYSLNEVVNELGQKIEFLLSEDDNYVANFKPVSTYTTRFNTLTFVFKRK